MSFQHQSLAAGKWFELSLMEQLGNVASEIGRARKWQHKDAKIYEACVFRAIELLSLTLSDSRWKSRYKEICRAKECVCDAYYGGKEYGSTFESLEKYFNHYAYAARNSVGS